MDEFQSALTMKRARLSEDLYGQGSRGLGTEPANKHSPGLGLSDNSFIPDDNAGQGSYHHQSGSSRKAKVPKTEAIPGYLCFSLPGASIKAPARRPYTPTRREQVGRIRKKGACLRCKIMKRACSGEDPCKSCLAAAGSTLSSRVLMWMDCIRPSLTSGSIFNQGSCTRPLNWVQDATRKLMDDDVHLDFSIPFEWNIDDASKGIALWLTDDSQPPAFSIVGLLSSARFHEMLSQAVDPRLSGHFRVLIHLASLLHTTGMVAGYRNYSVDETRSVRDYAGTQVLFALDSLLKPLRLEASDKKLEKMKTIFLILLGTVVAAKYTPVENEVVEGRVIETQKDALVRLLSHYLVYLGKSISLLKSTCDESVLVSTAKDQWNKPGIFTWLVEFISSGPSCTAFSCLRQKGRSKTTGFDDAETSVERPTEPLQDSDRHYEFRAPLDLGGMNWDDLVADLDMLKCISCGIFWPTLDITSTCDNCKTPAPSSEVQIGRFSLDSPSTFAHTEYHAFIFDPPVAGNGEVIPVDAEQHSSFPTSPDQEAAVWLQGVPPFLDPSFARHAFSPVADRTLELITPAAYERFRPSPIQSSWAESSSAPPPPLQDHLHAFDDLAQPPAGGSTTFIQDPNLAPTLVPRIQSRPAGEANCESRLPMFGVKHSTQDRLLI